MPRCLLPTALLFLLVLSQSAGAQEPSNTSPLPGESAGTGRRIEAADRLAEARKFAEALDEYVHILEEAGNDLVAVTPRQSVRAGTLCQLRIAALPSATLTDYRTRLENQAKKWLDQGSTTRDERLLMRIVEEAFVSRPTEKALEMLGDLAFERGEFAVASQWWTVLAPGSLKAKRLAQEPPAPPPWKKPEKGKEEPTVEWRYPNSQPDTVARVRAKLVMALIFRGENATEELAAFRELHPKAEGHLAGRTGNYAETLDKLIAQRIPRVTGGEGWTTFAGDASRNSALFLDGAEPRRLERLWRNDPTWRIRLDGRAAALAPKVERVLPGVEQARSLAVHPVIAGQYVLYATATSVTALDILDGTTQTWDLATELKIKLPAAKPGAGLALHPDPRYTVTVADGRVYARLGTPAIEPGKKLDEVASYLVCLDLPVPGQKMRLRWHRAAPHERETPVFFEGAPVVRDGRVYIAASRFTANQMTTAVQCYPADAEGSPEPRWSVDVFSIRELSAVPRYRHLLLTLAGQHVIACGHAGAVVALEKMTGKPAWGYHYPSSSSDLPGLPRELSPPLYAEGRLYVAPSDYKNLLCLDPLTGKRLWEYESVEPVHLLGMSAGRLVFTTPSALRSVDAVAGSDRSDWVSPADGKMTSWGRGFITNEFVIWPTMLRPDGGESLSGGVLVLDLASGDPTLQLIQPQPVHLRPGNMAYADDCLAVADAEELSVYVSPKRLLSQREESVRRWPDWSAAHFFLGVAQADAGRSSQAEESFAKALALCKPHESRDGIPLRERIASARHESLLDAAYSEKAAGHLEDSAALLTRAAGKEFPRQRRLDALNRLVNLWDTASKTERAVSVWQTILADEELRRGPLTDSRGCPQSAAVVAAKRVDQIVKQHGPSVYAAQERQAKTLFDTAPGAERTTALERLVCEFPNASSAAPALRELAKHYEDVGRWGAAAHAYRRLNAGAPEEASAGLSRASTKLITKPLEMAELSVPLARDWEATADGLRLISSRYDADDLVFGVGREVSCRTDHGRFRWKQTIAATATFSARHGDIVVAAGADGIAGISFSEGLVLWELPAPGSTLFSNFVLAGQRLFFLQDRSRVLALDVSTGYVLWQYRVRDGSISYLNATEDRVLLRRADHCLILDGDTGKLRLRLVTENHPHPSAPLQLDGSVCLIGDPRQISSLDLTTGQVRWERTLPRPLSLSGEPPDLVGDGRTVLAVLPRNYGFTVRRLHPKSGAFAWSEEALLGPDRIPSSSFAFDDRAAFVASRNIATALSLSDGSILWECSLQGPAGDWSLKRVGSLLIAYPSAGQTRKFDSRWLSVSLQLTIAQPPEERPGRGMPVLLLDPKTGEVLQRLNFFPEPRSETQVGLGDVLAGRPRLRAESDAGSPVVIREISRGLIVAWDGRVWGLRNSR
jgi:outer membrane protein assembly factor BamB